MFGKVRINIIIQSSKQNGIILDNPIFHIHLYTIYSCVVPINTANTRLHEHRLEGASQQVVVSDQVSLLFSPLLILVVLVMEALRVVKLTLLKAAITAIHGTIS